MTLLASFARGATEDATAFAKANQDYAAGHYKQAIDGYESLILYATNRMRLCSTIWATPGFAKEIPAAPFFNTNVLWRLIDNIQRRRQIFIWCVTKPVLWNCRKHEPIGIRFCDFRSVCMDAAIAFWIAIFALAVLLLGSRRSGATIAVLVGALLVFGEQLTLVMRSTMDLKVARSRLSPGKISRRDSQPPIPPGRFSPCPRAAK